MKLFLMCLILASSLFFAASFTHAATLIPRQRTRIRYATNYGFLTPSPTQSVKRTPVKKQSLLTKIWSSVGSGILGSLGVIAGAVIAWYTLNKKKKTFSTYYEQIKEAQRRYHQNLESNSINKEQAKSNYKKELILIQEEAELNTAEKKLDQEQLTAIINKVERMIDEITS